MKVAIEKLKEFEGKLKEISKSANGKNKNPMSALERQQGVEIAKEYYKYLQESGEIYGEAALQVVNNEGMFGKVANIHLRTQAVFDGIEKEYLPELQDRIKISLAYADIDKRMELKDTFNYKTISKYHISIFENQGLTPYAWGGLAVEELLGVGTYMVLFNQDLKSFEGTLGQLSKIKNKESEYSLDRMVSSLQHSFSCYIVHERDYVPMVRAGSPEHAAKWYGVDISRVVEYYDETPEMDCPLVPSYIYKILPKIDSTSPQSNIDMEALEQMLITLALIEQKKRIENQNKFNKLVEKVQESLAEYEDKANKIFGEFVKIKSQNLSKNGENLTNQVNAEIQQIAASLETKNASLLAQKQAELSAIPLVRVKTGPNSYLDTNEQAAAQKQAEYEALLAQYKSQYQSQIATIKARYEGQINQQKQSFESDISNKATIVKRQEESYAKKLISKLDEVKAKLSQGQDVDIDSIIVEIDESTASGLSNIQQSLNTASTIVLAVFDVIYDNPILNHPKLLNAVFTKFGADVATKFIDLCSSLSNTGEAQDIIEEINRLPSNLEMVASLMGLDHDDHSQLTFE
jgi:hypothetical protein